MSIQSKLAAAVAIGGLNPFRRDRSHETTILRPLGALEKLFWLMDQNRPVHFAITAEVGGFTRIAQWQDALDRVCRQSALIWSRIVPGEHGTPVFQPAPRGSIALHVVTNAASRWASYVAHQVQQPFDASKAPLLRATLLHGIDRSVIILCAHHAIADGLSLSYLVRDLLRTLVGEPVTLNFETAPLEHLVCRKLGTMALPVGQPRIDGAGADAVSAEGRVEAPYRGSAPHAGDNATPARAGAGGTNHPPWRPVRRRDSCSCDSDAGPGGSAASRPLSHRHSQEGAGRQRTSWSMHCRRRSGGPKPARMISGVGPGPSRSGSRQPRASKASLPWSA